MSRSTGSDTSEIRPAVNFCLGSNYWSEDDICHSGKREDHQLWSPIMQSTEEKDHTIDDNALTPKLTNQNDTSGKKKSRKSTVNINEDLNQIRTINTQSSQNGDENFRPGSNRSPSMLADTHFNQNRDQNQSTNITGHKRSQFDDAQNAAPSAKKQRISSLSLFTQDKVDTDWNYNNDELTYDELQEIQEKARNQFQDEMQAEGITPKQSFQRRHSHNSQFGKGNIKHRKHGSNDKSNQNNQSNQYQQNNSGQNSNNNNNRANTGVDNNSNRNRLNTGGGGDDSGDDSDDEDKNNNNNNNNNDSSKGKKRKKKKNDSDSESEDSDNDIANDITTSGNNKLNNNSNPLQKLQNQNRQLQEQLNNSNKQIEDLMKNINNSNSNNSNTSVSSNMAEINLYKELVKQQQMQLKHLMR